jgi:uncharacterized protein YozE (UPF0346 family)
MTFYTFMMRNCKNDDSPAGDLARDMKSDSEKFPRDRPCKFKGWHEQLYKYLVENDACLDCLRTFEERWEEYVRCEKKRLKRS